MAFSNTLRILSLGVSAVLVQSCGPAPKKDKAKGTEESNLWGYHPHQTRELRGQVPVQVPIGPHMFKLPDQNSINAALQGLKTGQWLVVATVHWKGGPEEKVGFVTSAPNCQGLVKGVRAQLYTEGQGGSGDIGPLYVDDCLASPATR